MNIKISLFDRFKEAAVRPECRLGLVAGMPGFNGFMATSHLGYSRHLDTHPLGFWRRPWYRFVTE